MPRIEHNGADTHFLNAAHDYLRTHDCGSELPLYVYSAAIASNNCARLRDALPDWIHVAYSLKANSEREFVSALVQNRPDIMLDVCSMYELSLAHELGVDPGKIVFTGPGKTRAELAKALQWGVKLIVCESLQEIEILNELAAGAGINAQCILRINPSSTIGNVEKPFSGSHSHFGIDLEELHSSLERIKGYSSTVVTGLHFYVGSRNLDSSSISANFSAFFEIFREVNVWFDGSLEILDLGGGFGVPYYDWEKPLDLTLLRSECGRLERQFASLCKTVIVESGRFIAASAALYVCEVLYTKQRAGKNYAIVNGGLCSFYLLSDHMGMDRQAFNRNFIVSVVGKHGPPPTVVYDLYGNAPTASDMLASDIALPSLIPGDRIVVHNAGAYGRAVSLSNFLGRGIPRAIYL